MRRTIKTKTGETIRVIADKGDKMALTINTGGPYCKAAYLTRAQAFELIAALQSALAKLEEKK